jgi:hypothetical protein
MLMLSIIIDGFGACRVKIEVSVDFPYHWSALASPKDSMP